MIEKYPEVIKGRQPPTACRADAERPLNQVPGQIGYGQNNLRSGGQSWELRTVEG